MFNKTYVEPTQGVAWWLRYMALWYSKMNLLHVKGQGAFLILQFHLPSDKVFFPLLKRSLFSDYYLVMGGKHFLEKKILKLKAYQKSSLQKYLMM